MLTINSDFPAGRPFGAIMEDNGFLYISTHDGNKAHKQLRENGNIQILAKKAGTREWLRITGKADECAEVELKQKMPITELKVYDVDELRKVLEKNGMNVLECHSIGSLTH